MSVKILASSISALDAFCARPLEALADSESGTVAVLANNAPAFYAVTPERMAQLLTSENARQQVALDDSLFEDDTADVAAPAGKFRMYQGWRPDADFLRQAAMWGCALTAPVAPEELAAFVAYWQAEGKFFHHIQWQQKLARSLIQGRMAAGGQKRDITQLPDGDYSIPKGFRG